MTDMIERVARAICENDGGSPDKDTLAGFLEWEIYRQPAIAAIKAMREPTPETIEAMKANIGPLAEMWRAGIDAALGENK